MAVAVDGQILVIGGGTPGRPDARVLASADGRRFHTIARLLVAVRYPAVAVVGGIVYVIGGSTPTGDSAEVQAIDPRSGAVRIVAHLAHGLAHGAALVVGGALLIAGGRTAGRSQDGLWRWIRRAGQCARSGICHTRSLTSPRRWSTASAT